MNWHLKQASPRKFEQNLAFALNTVKPGIRTIPNAGGLPAFLASPQHGAIRAMEIVVPVGLWKMFAPLLRKTSRRAGAIQCVTDWQ